MSHLYNQLEIFIWLIIGGLTFAIGFTKPRRTRVLFLLAGLDLIVFGFSDYFESTNGNEWWHPWWLLLWKAACLAILLALVAIGLRLRNACR